VKNFKLLKWSIIIVTAAILAYDVALIWLLGRFGVGVPDYENTISSQLYVWSVDYPVVAASGALLMGHLFVPAKPDSLFNRYWGLKVLAAVVAIGALALELDAWVVIATWCVAGSACWPNALRGK
jgi:hypothetical protein